MTEVVSERFLDRTLRNLRERWRDIANSAYDVLGKGAPSADLAEDDRARLRQQMRECLQARGGEVSARARAAELGRTYLSLSPAGRRRFLALMGSDFDVDHKAVAAAAAGLAKIGDGNADSRRQAERALRRALEPGRVKLLTQFNGLPEGVKFLVDLRADLLRHGTDDPDLMAVEHDLRHLLAGWFDVGFLELTRITWDAPASLLEKLHEYQAVHEVRGWTDLKNRLDADRRCFAFFHPRMPNEPLIFVEVALVKGLADSIQKLLDESAPVGDPRQADTAIFYSISNAQKGLANISFGGFLIKRVVDQLSAEFPRLKTFATLSPIPGFRHWLDEHLAEAGPGILTPAERKALTAAHGQGSKGAIRDVLAEEGWWRQPELAKAMKGPVLRLVARYLLKAKEERGRALDPVANFHLSNGARVERLNWLADTSPKGMRQSAGVMVNYLYRLTDIETNHEAYAAEKTVTASSAVSGLA